MFKLLTYIVLFYLLYRWVIKPALPAGWMEEEKPKIKVRREDQRSGNHNQDEGDYIDYEEVD